MPRETSRLFWDVDLSALDLEKHGAFVIERVLNLGDEVAVKWVWQKYGATAVYDTVINSRRLTLKTARCWQNYFGLEEGQMRCFSTFWTNLDSVC